MTGRRAGTALLSAALLLPVSARADKATEAKVHFKRGVHLYQKGRAQAALAEFFLSNRLSPNASVTFNIARCLELLGNVDEAFIYFTEYRDLARTKLNRP